MAVNLENLDLDETTNPPLDFESFTTGPIEPGNNLQFRDFPATSNGLGVGVGSMGRGMDQPQDESAFSPTEEREKLIMGPPAGGELSPAAAGNLGGSDIEAGVRGDMGNQNRGYCWNLTFYQPYFDVTTADVLKRLRLPFSSLPIKSLSEGAGNFWDTFKYYPDMYGPVWVSATLILCIAFCGNVSSLLRSRLVGPSFSSSPRVAATGEGGEGGGLLGEDGGGDGGSSSSSSSSSGESFLISDCEADLQKLTVAATLVTAVCLLGPLLLWFLLVGRGTKAHLTRLISLTGYGLAPFVPATMACAIPVAILQWILLITASALSFVFLLKHMKAEIEEALPVKHRVSALAGVGVLYGIFLLTLKFYFFSAAY
uniref:Uncharacterized protein n=1 Tax=Chromera velia CCMP2878 TaxID=1169474 RepID=A0A0G4HGS0_9ALVE|eukprot:Cvel_1011.t1-p1 / transcript=Cvel_1011.t1 / gene=Cvel_1011 / organism=Chromera_velia_CCMP2878 / gene_product=Protein YIPF1 homolog, putative / transcript_product=Protein YIPF1 homolog, putative / location=Cvel_scaffold33:15917-21414(+) / protein_length=369 / sequence_SO=supercontig / SO=protein_coding / is_pseudo=false